MHTRSFLATSAVLLAAAGCRGDTTSPTEPALQAAQAAVPAATSLVFWQVSAGMEFSCGVTTDDQAFCWGDGYPGQLGIGTYTDQYCMDHDSCITRPTAVAGGLRFELISAGDNHACAITPDIRAYCWGGNAQGQLGTGTTGPETCQGNESDWPCSTRPLAVVGGLSFRSVSAGARHTCGVTSDGLAYCWGYNPAGQLGDGTTTTRLRPRAVAGGLRFRDVSAGDGHTCGVTVDSQAYCWGANDYGQLGDSTKVARRLRPVRVAGRRQFRQLDAGASHTCATTSTYRAFCWGRGDYGQLGIGRTLVRSFWPRRVAGTLSFNRVTAGGSHTCAEATDNRAYCWGRNWAGQLGDGTTTTRLTPVAVQGGWYFRQLSAGYSHTCGKTAAAEAYCWGENRWGGLGDGTTTRRLTPTPVGGPL